MMFSIPDLDTGLNQFLIASFLSYQKMSTKALVAPLTQTRINQDHNSNKLFFLV